MPPGGNSQTTRPDSVLGVNERESAKPIYHEGTCRIRDQIIHFTFKILTGNIARSSSRSSCFVTQCSPYSLGGRLFFTYASLIEDIVSKYISLKCSFEHKNSLIQR